MSYGPKPTPVTDEVVRMARYIEEYGTLSKEVMEEIERVYEGARVDVARLLGASTDEVALTRHVSEGINIVATGIDWEPGDEVIVTDEEHPAGSLPWMNLMKRRGIVVRQLPLAPYETDGIVERLDDLITPRTKLLCMSHVSTRTGFVLPAREVSETAHKRGVPVLLDGAHAVGLIPVNVKELGCDFYSGCGHKWLLAPQGTGFLYVDADKLDDLQITWIGASSAPTWDADTYEFEPLTTAAKFEFGTRDKAVFSSLSTAIAMAEEVGIENIASPKLGAGRPSSPASHRRARLHAQDADGPRPQHGDIDLRRWPRRARSHGSPVGRAPHPRERQGRGATSLDPLLRPRRGDRQPRRYTGDAGQGVGIHRGGRGERQRGGKWRVGSSPRRARRAPRGEETEE